MPLVHRLNHFSEWIATSSNFPKDDFYVSNDGTSRLWVRYNLDFVNDLYDSEIFRAPPVLKPQLKGSITELIIALRQKAAFFKFRASLPVTKTKFSDSDKAIRYTWISRLESLANQLETQLEQGQQVKIIETMQSPEMQQEQGQQVKIIETMQSPEMQPLQFDVIESIPIQKELKHTKPDIVKPLILGVGILLLGMR